MKSFILAIIAIIVIIFAAVALRGDTNTSINNQSAQASTTQSQPTTPQFETISSTPITVPEGRQIVTLAGGCFWCVEAVFQETAGVDDVISGFAGGTEADPSYEAVVRGQTAHREAIQFTYDPNVISYSELLDIYWRAIDPSDAGGQFVDRGYIYTTAIYYHDADQKSIAETSTADIQNSRNLDAVATELLPYTTFFPAEEYHQDYYKKSADRYKLYETNSGRPEYQATLN